MKDSTIQVAQVIGANATAWAVALNNINVLLISISTVLATAFTIYKWVKALKENKKD